MRSCEAGRAPGWVAWGAGAQARRRPGGTVLLVLAVFVTTAGAQTRQMPQQRLQETTTAHAPTASPPPAPTAATALEPDAALRARFISPELLDAPVDPDTYLLGPGDVLAVMLLVGETRTEQLPVLPEGDVIMPNIGTIQAAGLTLTDFREAFRRAVGRRYKDFELYCSLARQRQFRVYVTGEVATPGVLAARATERVSDVIDRAGGFTEQASRREIELLDGRGGVARRADLMRFLALGDLAANPFVASGQVVRVPPLGRQAPVLGEVRDPGTLEVRHGDTVRELLDLAGGITEVADLSNVTVERTDSTGAVTVRTYDLGTESPPADNVTRVTVLSKMIGKRRVFFISPDDKQQTIYLGEGETLAGLVRRTANLPPEADLAGAQLATKDADGKPLQVHVDLARVLAGEQDRPLQDGDVLSVPSVKGYVYVSGLVPRPGRYAYRAEWTVNDYLGEAGGPAPGGSKGEVTLLGADGSSRSANRRTPVRRGETVFVDRGLGSKSVIALSVLINVTALALSVIALSK